MTQTQTHIERSYWWESYPPIMFEFESWLFVDYQGHLNPHVVLGGESFTSGLFGMKSAKSTKAGVQMQQRVQRQGCKDWA